MHQNRNLKKKQMLGKCCRILICACITLICVSHFITYILFKDCSQLIKRTINEGIFAIFALCFMKITHDALHLKKPKKARSLFPIPQIIFFTPLFIIKLYITNIRYQNCDLRPFSEIIAYVLFVLFIGIAEESIFRGVVAELMLRKYGRNKEGKKFAVFITGLLFGVVHLANIGQSGFIGVICQMCGTFVTGMIFTEMYYRHRSILRMIILHSVIDFFAIIGYGLYGTTTPEKVISSYRPVMLVPYALVSVLFILRWNRKKKDIV